MIYIAQDNGTTGRLAALSETGVVLQFLDVPTRDTLAFTKKKQRVTRIDWQILRNWYESLKTPPLDDSSNLRIFVERPMIFPGRFTASVSAARAFEAALIALEAAGLQPTAIVDSKAWQRLMFPQGWEKGETKKLSRELGCRLFPQHQQAILRTKDTDADALLMAECARRERW